MLRFTLAFRQAAAVKSSRLENREIGYGIEFHRIKIALKSQRLLSITSI